MSLDCYCDYDPPSFCSRTTPRARRTHTCEECGAKIIPGEIYERVSGKWDGWVSTFCTCERCHDLRKWLTNNLPCYCWGHGDGFDSVVEDIRELERKAPEEMRGILFGYYRRVVERNRFKELRNSGLA